MSVRFTAGGGGWGKSREAIRRTRCDSGQRLSKVKRRPIRLVWGHHVDLDEDTTKTFFQTADTGSINRKCGSREDIKEQFPNNVL